MRFIDPATLDPIDGGAGYGSYLRGIWPTLPAGLVALVEAVFHDGWLSLAGEEPAAGTLRFKLRNYVGDGWVVYDIVYSGVSAVEAVEGWPAGEVTVAAPPYGRWFGVAADGEEAGMGVHRDELHRAADGRYEHRLMTLAGSVRVIHFRDAAVTCRAE